MWMCGVGRVLVLGGDGRLVGFGFGVVMDI